MAQDLLFRREFVQFIGNVRQSRDEWLAALLLLIQLFGAKPLSDIRQRSNRWWIAGGGWIHNVLAAGLAADSPEAIVGIEAFALLEINTVAAAVADLAACSAVVGGVSTVSSL